MGNFTETRQEIWSAYWQAGHVDSCTSSIKSDDSEIELFWKTTAAEIQESDVVVDLCTGRGATLNSLLSYLNEDVEPVFYGVDLAGDYVLKRSSLFESSKRKIQFFPNTAIDSIPLQDASVNIFVSQFGVEYALSDSFYDEMHRLIVHGGRFHAVLHHKNSILSQIADEEIKQIDFILDQVNLIETVHELSTYFALLKNPANVHKLNNNPEAVNSRNEYNRKLAQVRDRMNAFKAPDLLLDTITVCNSALQLARENGKKAAKNYLLAYVQELNNSRFRSQELINSAMSIDDVSTLVDAIQDRFSIESSISELRSRGELVAWGLKLKRA